MLILFFAAPKTYSPSWFLSWIFEVFLRIGWPLKSRGWSKIHLRHRRGIRPIGEIGVIPPTRIIGVSEWVIGRSGIKIVDTVDCFTNI